MKNYRELIVWQKAHQVVLNIYKASQSFPKDELYALTSQVRRAAVSIPSNIAEGGGRYSQADFAHFLQIAIGSNQELDYLILLAFDLNYMSHELYTSLHSQINEVRAMLISLTDKVRRSPRSSKTS
jgi:four helix bundle protein